MTLRNIPIRAALVAWFALLLAIAGGILWASSQAQLREIFIQQAETSLAFEAREKADALAQRLNGPMEHLKMLRDNWAIHERAALDAAGGTSDDDVRDAMIDREIERLFRSHLKNVPETYQIRLISAASTNRELVRVVRREGEVARVPEIELQEKGHRDYVQRALRLGLDQVSCSEITLNRERGEIERPLRPTHRLLAPVHVDGEVAAMLVVNQDVAGPLRRLAETFPWPAEVYVFNEQGGYLTHPDEGRAFAFELGDDAGVAEEFPAAFARFREMTEAREQRGWRAPAGLHSLYTLGMGHGDERYHLGLLVKVEYPHLLPGLAASLREATWAVLLVLVLGVALALVAANTLARPIASLNAAVCAFARGERPRWGGGLAVSELESLRRSFMDMSGRLERSSQRLEERVEARTHELQERNELLAEEISRHRVTRARLHLSHQVMERSRQAVVITDADNRIVEVNEAYVEMTGFSRDEAVGRTPSIGKSGRHDKAFYQRMWGALEADNHWEGEVWDRREDGSVFPKYLTIDRLLDEEGNVVNYVAMFEDLSEQKATEEELEKLTHYDLLTGLSNRALFRHRLEHEFEVCKRHRCSTALMLINLDRFKQVNDSLGHLAGDALIQQVAKRLDSLVRKSDLVARDAERPERKADTLARMGGDEFSVILSDLRDPENAAVVARRMQAVFAEPFVVEEREVHLSVSVGIATYPQNADNQEDLVLCAERAMDDARRAGGNVYRFYSEEMNRSSADRFQLEGEMRKAVAAEAFTVFYQPKINLESGTVEGMEALVRWPREDGGMVSPGDFIPLAEENGLIVPLGEWILRRACRDTRELSERLGRPLTVAVNLSARQFQHTDIVGLVEQVTMETGLPLEQLELEITESMVMGEVEQSIATMERLREMGVSLAIDDFGTGYSSLAYLKRFPLNTLKIDQSFVRDLEEDSDDAAIVATVCSMGRQLGLAIVAEGIENPGQLAFLREQQCRYGQGFHICRPLPLEAFEAFVAEQG